MSHTAAQRENRVFFGAHALWLGIVLVGFGRSFFLRPAFLSSPLPLPPSMGSSSLRFAWRWTARR